MSRIALLLTAAMLSLAAPARAEVLPLPDNLIALDSDAGEQLLFGSEAHSAYFRLSEQFLTQQNQAFCGVASMVMILNALRMPAPESEMLKPFSAFDQNNIFNASTEAVIPRATIEHMGMTLDQLGGFAAASGLKAEVHHAEDGTLEAFRESASDYLTTPDHYVVINYLRSAIGQQKYGHISPLAAYDADTDRFLILDVSRYKYPPVWVAAAELFDAMNTPDSDNDNRSRGYILISR